MLHRLVPGPDQTCRYGDLPDQVVDLWSVEGSALPPVVFIHGGFWRPGIDRTHARSLAAALRTAGHPVALVEYRRIPGEPTAATGDVLAALRDMPELFGAPWRRPVLAGHSAGGHLALWAAAAGAQVLAVLALAPVADLISARRLGTGRDAVGTFLGARWQAVEMDPASMATPDCPVTLLHGLLDGEVPPSLSRSYAARHPDTRLVEVDGAGHYGLIDPLSGVWPTVLREVRASSQW